MAHDHLPTPAAMQQEDLEHEILVDTIYTIADEVDQRLTSIRTNKLPEPETDDERIEHVMLSIYEKQLECLSQLILDAAEFEDYDPAINIDAPALDLVDAFIQDIYGSQLFMLHQEKMEPAFDEIRKDCADYFLSILVPEGVTDTDIRSVYFLPWRKDLIADRFDVSENKDGSMHFSRPTRLSNIFVSYDYAPQALLPVRTIHLA